MTQATLDPKTQAQREAAEIGEQKDRLGWFDGNVGFWEPRSETTGNSAVKIETQGIFQGSLTFNGSENSANVSIQTNNPDVLNPNYFTSAGATASEATISTVQKVGGSVLNLGQETVSGAFDLGKMLVGKDEEPTQEPKTEEEQIADANAAAARQSYREQENNSLKAEQESAIKEAERLMGEVAGMSRDEQNTVQNKQAGFRVELSYHDQANIRANMKNSNGNITADGVGVNIDSGNSTGNAGWGAPTEIVGLNESIENQTAGVKVLMG